MVAPLLDESPGQVKQHCAGGPIVTSKRPAFGIIDNAVIFPIETRNAANRIRHRIHMRAEHQPLPASIPIHPDNQIARIASVLALLLRLVDVDVRLGNTDLNECATQMIGNATFTCRRAFDWEQGHQVFNGTVNHWILLASQSNEEG